ncbi:MAG: hypothetical protein DRI80_13540, partial [Chloroflexota bacterium]
LMRDRLYVGGEFAPLVARAADEGDIAAQEILRKAGRIVGENGVSIARRLGMLETEFVLVAAGGVFSSHNRCLDESLLATVRIAAPQVRLEHWDAPPVVGAVLLALDMLRREALTETSSLAQEISTMLRSDE